MAIVLGAGVELLRNTAPTTTNLTMVAFGRLTAVGSSYRTIATFSAGGATNANMFIWQLNGSEQLLWYNQQNGNESAVVTGAPLTAGNWFGLAFRLTGTALKQYVRPASSATISTATATRSTTHAPNQIVFGESPFSEEWQGALMGVRIWEAALSDVEVSNELYSLTSVRRLNLWAEWPLLNASDLRDISGNGRNLTVQAGTPTALDNHPPLKLFQRGRRQRRVTIAGAVDRTVQASLESVVQAAQTKSAALSLVPQATLSQSAALSAAVQQQAFVSAATSAVVRATQQIQAAASATVQAQLAKQAALEAAAQATLDVSADLSAAVADVKAVTAALEVVPQAQLSKSAALSSTVSAQLAQQAGLSAAVQAQLSKSAGLSVVPQATQSISAGLGVHVSVAGEDSVSASLDAVVQAQLSKSAGLSTTVQDARALSAALSATVSQTAAAQTALSVVVQDRLSKQAALQATIQERLAKQAALSAAVSAAQSQNAALTLVAQDRRTASAALSAFVILPGASVSASLSATVQAALSKSAQLSAHVSDGSALPVVGRLSLDTSATLANLDAQASEVVVENLPTRVDIS